jgi:hypothetical protein
MASRKLRNKSVSRLLNDGGSRLLSYVRERARAEKNRTRKIAAQLCCRSIGVNEITAERSAEDLSSNKVETDQSLDANFDELNVEKARKNGTGETAGRIDPKKLQRFWQRHPKMSSRSPYDVRR